MGNTRRTFLLSLGVSSLMVWFFFGFPPFGHNFLPAPAGSALNALIELLAIPLTLAIIAGGGLATAESLASNPDEEATHETERRKLALLAPAGVVWVLFVASMAFPLGLIGNIIVVCASGFAILRILQNAIVLGVFRVSSGPGTSAVGESLGSCPNR